jgi:hypothetical protein
MIEGDWKQYCIMAHIKQRVCRNTAVWCIENNFPAGILKCAPCKTIFLQEYWSVLRAKQSPCRNIEVCLVQSNLPAGILKCVLSAKQSPCRNSEVCSVKSNLSAGILKCGLCNVKSLQKSWRVVHVNKALASALPCGHRNVATGNTEVWPLLSNVPADSSQCRPYAVMSLQEKYVTTIAGFGTNGRRSWGWYCEHRPVI